ncbi:unnamed protein product, partial [Didymodactylos carnosus]
CLNNQNNEKQKLLFEIFSNTKSCDSSLPTLSTLAKNTIIESFNTISSEESVEEEQTNEETKEIIIDSYKSTLLNHVECEQSDKEEYKTSSSSVTMGKHSVLIYSEYQNIYSNEELDIGQHHFPNLIPVKGVAILFASKTVPK